MHVLLALDCRGKPGNDDCIIMSNSYKQTRNKKTRILLKRVSQDTNAPSLEQRVREPCRLDAQAASSFLISPKTALNISGVRRRVWVL